MVGSCPVRSVDTTAIVSVWAQPPDPSPWFESIKYVFPHGSLPIFVKLETSPPDAASISAIIICHLLKQAADAQPETSQTHWRQFDVGANVSNVCPDSPCAIVIACTIVRISVLALAILALSRAEFSEASTIEESMPMMEMTTRSSIRVKPRSELEPCSEFTLLLRCSTTGVNPIFGFDFFILHHITKTSSTDT